MLQRESQHAVTVGLKSGRAELSSHVDTASKESLHRSVRFETVLARMVLSGGVE